MLKPLDRQIIEIMSDNAYVTIPEISKAIGVSIPTVNRHIKELANRDMIKRIGSRKAGYWKVK